MGKYKHNTKVKVQTSTFFGQATVALMIMYALGSGVALLVWSTYAS